MLAHRRSARAAALLLGAATLAVACAASAATTPPPAPVRPGQPPRPGPIEQRFTALSRAITPIANRDEPRARAFADSVMRDAAARGDVLEDAAARFWRGRQHMRDYALAAGLPYLDSAEVVARSVRDTVMLARIEAARGNGYQVSGRIKESRAAFDRALRHIRATQFGSLEGFVRRALGYMAKTDGRYDDALRELNAVLRLVDFSTFEHLHSRLMIAETLNRLGRHEEARVRMDSVLTEARRRNTPWIAAAALQDLGILAYEQGDMAAADRQWEFSAAVYDSMDQAPSAINVRINRARALARLGRHAEAQALLEHLIAEGGRIEDRAPGVAATGELGRLLRETGRHAQAERLLRRARLESAGNEVDTHDFVTIQLAGVLSETGRAAEAEALLDSLVPPDRAASIMHDDHAAIWYERSVARRARGRYPEALAAAREAERLARRPTGRASIYWLDAAVEVGRCHRALGNPDSAVAILGKAARAWERWRADLSDLEWRERAASGLSGLFAEYGLALLDPRRRVPEATRVRQAFDALQTFQARTLEERMHGQGLSARAMSRRVSADSLRRSVLREGELLLDLVATPDTTFAFAVTRAGVSVAMLRGTGRLDPLFHTWRDAMRSDASARTVEQGLQRLSSELLAPVAEPVRASRRLIVSGGGSFALWPLSALTLPGEAVPLGETRDVVGTPSATLFALLRARAAPVAAPRVLAVSRTTNLAGRDLPGAERELRLLDAEYGGVTVRRNPGDRSVRELTADLPRFDALHFAAHAEADGGSPWRSGFLLGGGDRDDAYLRASDVAGMRLRARLAVLSGCASAGATTLAGEGALGLSSAFLCAGITSVVATLWPVEDRAAERFVTAFYAAIAGGRTVAAAAREARAALRAAPATANPRDWAAFVVVGEPGTRLPLRRRQAAAAAPARRP